DRQQVGLGRGCEVMQAIAVGQQLELLPAIPRIDRVRVAHRSDVPEEERGGSLEGVWFHLLEGHLGQLDARLEEVLQQRLWRGRLGLFVGLVEVPEVLPVIEDEELFLVATGAEEVFSQAGAS